MRPARYIERFEVTDYDQDVLEVMLSESGRGQGPSGRVVAHPWCDCKQVNKLNGRKQLRSGFQEGNFFVTEVDDDGICEHCGHFAIFSVKDPTNNEVGLGLVD